MTIKKTKHSFENAHSKRRNVCVFLLLCVVLLSAFAIPSYADTTTAEIDYNLFNGWNFCPQADWTLAEGFDGVVEVLDYGILYRTTYASESTIDFLPFSLSNIAPYAKSGYEYTFRVTHREPGVDIIIDGEVVNNQDEFVLTSSNLNAPIQFRRPIDATQEGVSVDVYIRFQFFCRSEEQAGGVDRLLAIDTPFSVTEEFVSRVDAFYNSSVQDAFNAGYNVALENFTPSNAIFTSENTTIDLWTRDMVNNELQMPLVRYPTPLNMATNTFTFTRFLPSSTFFYPSDNIYTTGVSLICFTDIRWTNAMELYIRNTSGITYIIIEDYEGTQLFYGELPPTGADGVNVFDTIANNIPQALNGERIGKLSFRFMSNEDGSYYYIDQGAFVSIKYEDDPYYDIAYRDGYLTGYDQGVANGEQAGYDNGVSDTEDYYNTNVIPNIQEIEYNNGYNTGRNNGYIQGLAEGANGSNPFYAVITAPVDSAVRMFKQFLNFEILGVNLFAFFGSILTLMVAVVIIKFAIKFV